MNQITILTVGGSSYAITDPGKLPQPETPVQGQLLTVEAVEEGKVSRVGGISPQSLGAVKTVNGISPNDQGNVKIREVFQFDIDEMTVYTSPQTLYDAWQAGKELVLEFSREAPWCFRLPLVEIHFNTENGFETMVFSGTTKDQKLRTVTVYADGSCQYWEDSVASREDLGEISEALDRILALQEELIG